MTNKEIKEDVRRELYDFCEELNQKYKWCNSHNEGLYCHLDNRDDNDENIIPAIGDFVDRVVDKLLKPNDD